MQQCPSWEADSRSVSQEIPRLMEPKDSVPCSQEPATGPCPEPDESTPHPPTLFYYPF
jgi:hypothetical protein